MRKPYHLLDTYDMTLLGEYFTQDRAMQDFYNLLRKWGFTTARTVNLIYVNDDDEETLLCYGNEPEIKDWYKELERMTLELRLRGGTDILGLNEFLQHNAQLHPTWTESDVPPTTLDYDRYKATFGPYSGHGATKLEALTRAYLLYREAYPNGEPT